MKASYMSKQMLTHDMAHVNRTKLIKKQKERENSKLSYLYSNQKLFSFIENSVLDKIKQLKKCL